MKNFKKVTIGLVTVATLFSFLVPSVGATAANAATTIVRATTSADLAAPTVPPASTPSVHLVVPADPTVPTAPPVSTPPTPSQSPVSISKADFRYVKTTDTTRNLSNHFIGYVGVQAWAPPGATLSLTSGGSATASASYSQGGFTVGLSVNYGNSGTVTVKAANNGKMCRLAIYADVKIIKTDKTLISGGVPVSTTTSYHESYSNVRLVVAYR